MPHQDRAGFKKNEVLFRDDQIDPLRLTDEIRRLGRGGRKAALLDTGVFGLVELEWLAKEGLRLYTSDEAGRPAPDLIRIGEEIRKAGGGMFYFHNGTWDGDSSPAHPSFADLVDMGRSGIDIHVSNRERDRDPVRLCELARACREGRAWFVYYHAGRVSPWIEDLARCGAWIHLTEESLAADGDVLIVKDAAAAARRRGFNIILHLASVRNVSWVKDLLEAGVLVLMETAPSDYRSPLRELEAESKKTRLEPRTYYLNSPFLP
jgi:hypothetical protein